MFQDLELCDDTFGQDHNQNTLSIQANKVLGKGGFGFVCKGEIEASHGAFGSVRGSQSPAWICRALNFF